ncbi:MAG: DUF370 domain-containing protein [Syntrophomonadaceae bacterium]|nr:DUF370 domain-containing protein [Syntrophomonadaceae bacterium]
MYIHLGSDCMVPLGKVIAIVNIEPPVSASVKELIELAIIDKRMLRICEKGKEKSLVLTDSYAYASPISSVTLLKRARNVYKEV